MHICFILENSLTMLQKSSASELCIFDQVKTSLELVIKNILKSWSLLPGQESTDVIHLFVTSSTEPISSYTDNHEIHIIHQLRNLECTVPTFPAEVIESALFHVGKFKCLNETQTFLGYRECSVSEPALIYYITDNSNLRQIQKINNKILQNKLHMRAEYKLVTIKYCAGSQQEANLTNLDKFRAYVESQRQSKMMEEVMSKVNGKLQHVYSSKGLIGYLQNAAYKGVSTLGMGVGNREYKIYNKEIVKVQLTDAAAEQRYLQRVKSLKPQCKLAKSSADCSIDTFIEIIPTYYTYKIPLPHELAPKILSDGRIVIGEFEPLKYFVDFGKEYIGTLIPAMKLFHNIYEIAENKDLLAVLQEFTSEKKFPLFYQRDKTQYLIGYLRTYMKKPQTPSSRTCELFISFSNFTNLNANIRSYLERNPSSEQYFQNYISTLPLIYHKVLKVLLQFSNIALSPQTKQCFDNIHNKPIGMTNLKFYEQRLTEKNQLSKLLLDSVYMHEDKAADCCPVHSDSFQQWQAQRSQVYSKQKIPKSTETPLAKFFAERIQVLNEMQPQTFSSNYLAPQQIHSSSMQSEAKKLNNIRRDDEEMDKLVGGIFGNPFRKINKKLKLHVEAESVWVEPGEVESMKELLNKEMELFHEMQSQFSAEQIAEMENILKSESIYDKLTGLKGFIADAMKKVQKAQNGSNQSGKNMNPRDVFSEQESESLEDNFGRNKFQYLSQTERRQVGEGERMVEESQEGVEVTTGELSEDEEKQIYARMGESQKEVSGGDEARQVGQRMEVETAAGVPHIIEDVNGKFQMLKPAVLQIPAHLICNELYLRNKAFINEALLTYLGLGQEGSQ